MDRWLHRPALLVLAALPLLLAIVTLFFGKPHKKTLARQANVMDVTDVTDVHVRR